MSGDVSDRKRLISIKGGNLRNAHPYISGHHDFFPDECYGPSSKKNGLGTEMTLLVEGLPDAVKTDIAKDGTNGRRRNFFRNRRWVRRFSRRHVPRQDANPTMHRRARTHQRLLKDGR